MEHENGQGKKALLAAGSHGKDDGQVSLLILFLAHPLSEQIFFFFIRGKGVGQSTLTH